MAQRRFQGQHPAGEADLVAWEGLGYERKLSRLRMIKVPTQYSTICLCHPPHEEKNLVPSFASLPAPNPMPLPSFRGGRHCLPYRPSISPSVQLPPSWPLPCVSGNPPVARVHTVSATSRDTRYRGLVDSATVKAPESAVLLPVFALVDIVAAENTTAEIFIPPSYFLLDRQILPPNRPRLRGLAKGLLLRFSPTLPYSSLSFFPGLDAAMLWTLFMKFLLVSSLIAWWLKRPNSRFQKFVLAAASLATFWVIAPIYAQLCLAWSVHYTREGIRHWSLDELLVQHASMLVTLAAVIWLLHRAWQTLWKPTTDLISILGVDVPEAPDVSLAGIRPDAATLNWTRPTHNRPVQKFLIQVNGVNVGESRQEETAITVTGLRPNHCYNIRVIAVGPNNFQAGSQVIRLRTYRSDGRPELGNSRLPDSFQDQDPRPGQTPCTEDNGSRSQVPTIEAAPSLEGGSAAARDGPSGQRRNTVNRRHSPSIASQEQPSIKDFSSDHPEASLKELADTLERSRKEFVETASLHASEESEFRQLEERLKKEKEEKKKIQKEKDDNTAQLRQKVKSTGEQMRQATKDKARKENLLKEKQDKRKKVADNIEKCVTETKTMRKTREGFASEKEILAQSRDLKIKHLDEENFALQDEYSQLETEYKEKKEQLKELEDARRKLPGGEEDDMWREDDRKIKRDFEMKRRELQSQLIMENRKAQQLEGHIHVLHAQVYAQNQQSIQFYNQANSSGVEFDQNASAQIKRRSRTSNALPNNVASPTGPFPATDSPFEPPIGFSNRVPFSHFLDMSGGDAFGSDQYSDAEIRALTGNAPLSPTAAALLPSGILGDDEPTSPDSFSRRSPFVVEYEDDAQSPGSSRRSNSVPSSPPGSSHVTAFPLLAPDNGDPASLRDITSSPGRQPSPAAGTHRFTDMITNWNRSKGAKAVDDGGPMLGSLKHGQSQSFPRQTDDLDGTNRRRTSFSSYTQNRNSAGPDTLEAASGSNLGRSMFSSARRLIPWNSYADRDPSSPRPASMASADLPRPSTDSGSIWNHPADRGGRFWSPDGRWTSRTPSRRPSLHGSPAALKTTLASAEDEILDHEALNDPQVSPSQVGVIGSRPPASKQNSDNRSLLGKSLNPAAPTFSIGGLFRSKDKESDSGKEKDKSKSKEKSKDKAKDKDAKEKGKIKDIFTPNLDLPQGYDTSPTESRKSRDAFSVHTQTSVTESRESLTLDRAVSNTLSDSNTKDPENAYRKLFRKGSSSKFSLSSRLSKDSGLFKKGPGSTTNSDKNLSADRSSFGDIDDFGEEGFLGRSYESVTSSPSGPAKSRDAKESRISGWSSKFSMKKKGKDNRESLEFHQAAPEGEVEVEDKKDE
ncbi:fibronectin type III domain-containing protein [Colletotrichum orchidophilum]|uniref:Fibronectin type III domain-containing protein n=1 Tax=Colletotrichum orchidophilum TaxID=1209926 RepID=A0A1G4AWM9_9PEZI|nr:fibronectin type III domain-containing protein [Colletotrichum orchidophilum]OHE93525.1 fibronectin type III domain-containing protein [Colletotrichum orchidophilum]